MNIWRLTGKCSRTVPAWSRFVVRRNSRCNCREPHSLRASKPDEIHHFLPFEDWTGWCVLIGSVKHLITENDAYPQYSASALRVWTLNHTGNGYTVGTANPVENQISEDHYENEEE